MINLVDKLQAIARMRTGAPLKLRQAHLCAAECSNCLETAAKEKREAGKPENRCKALTSDQK